MNTRVLWNINLIAKNNFFSDSGYNIICKPVCLICQNKKLSGGMKTSYNRNACETRKEKEL